LPGEVLLGKEPIEINASKKKTGIVVRNIGDRPIQVGSHFHFFEVNEFLEFEREQAYMKRLDIAAGTSGRFEPGEEAEVSLIDLGGNKIVQGLRGLTRS
jgi:urease beta subunit